MRNKRISAADIQPLTTAKCIWSLFLERGFQAASAFEQLQTLDSLWACRGEAA